ncbi:EamA family transporter [Empedobacter brevis]|uniref:EamA family transporter n=1 Tax=Empedobacter brevis TaxID=247 RepID=UPI0030B7FE07
MFRVLQCILFSGHPGKIFVVLELNTIIAIVLGWLILDEEISKKFIVPTILIICGVFITNYKPEIFKKRII